MMYEPPYVMPCKICNTFTHSMLIMEDKTSVMYVCHIARYIMKRMEVPLGSYVYDMN